MCLVWAALRNNQGKDPKTSNKTARDGREPSTSPLCDKGGRKQEKDHPQKKQGGGDNRQWERWRDAGARKKARWRRRKKKKKKKQRKEVIRGAERKGDARRWRTEWSVGTWESGSSSC